MKLRFGTHDVAQILEDGSVTLDLRAVTAALKLARANTYPTTDTSDGALCVGVDALVALQALASHKHEGPKTWRKRLKEWL